MDDKEFFDIFKRNKNSGDKIPDESVWERLESKLEKSEQGQLTQKKRRAVWMSYAAAIILILLIPTFIILYFIRQNDTGHLAQNKKIEKVDSSLESYEAQASEHAIEIDEKKLKTTAIIEKEKAQAKEKTVVRKIPKKETIDKAVKTNIPSPEKKMIETPKILENKQVVERPVAGRSVKKGNDNIAIKSSNDEAAKAEKMVMDDVSEADEAELNEVLVVEGYGAEEKDYVAFDATSVHPASGEKGIRYKRTASIEENCAFARGDVSTTTLHSILQKSNGKMVFANNWKEIGFIIPGRKTNAYYDSAYYKKYFNDGRILYKTDCNYCETKYYFDEEKRLIIDKSFAACQEMACPDDEKINTWKNYLVSDSSGFTTSEYYFKQYDNRLILYFTIENTNNETAEKKYYSGYLFEAVE